MNLIELLPTYDKVEIYHKYRTYTQKHTRSGYDRDYDFDLHIIYFEKFVILRDVPSVHSNNNKYLHQKQPVLVPRIFFDKVHPLNDGITKAKRFLVLGENYSETKGDLVKRGDWNIQNINNRIYHSSGLLNTALNEYPQNKSYTKEQRSSLLNLIELLISINKFLTDFPSSEPQQKIFRPTDSQHGLDYHLFLQIYLHQGNSYLDAVKTQEVVLTPEEIEVVYQELLNTYNNNNNNNNNDDDDDNHDNNNHDYYYDDDSDFGYLAGLVADGELGPNDPRYPF